MKKQILGLILGASSLLATELTTFTSGTSAKASEVNQNFTTLQDRIKYPIVKINNITVGYYMGQNFDTDNGIELEVITKYGYKFFVMINEIYRLDTDSIYYSSASCSGDTMYISTNSWSGTKKIGTVENDIYYVTSNPATIDSSSLGTMYKFSNNTCSEQTPPTSLHKVSLNDSSITGFDSSILTSSNSIEIDVGYIE